MNADACLGCRVVIHTFDPGAEGGVTDAEDPSRQGRLPLDTHLVVLSANAAQTCAHPSSSVNTSATTVGLGGVGAQRPKAQLLLYPFGLARRAAVTSPQMTPGPRTNIGREQ
jgi:hypothetical protein